jgi:hypothetical protein
LREEKALVTTEVEECGPRGYGKDSSFTIIHEAKLDFTPFDGAK